uniref:NADH dehydrogenase [ubiquinone] 1 alpha subcomplex assembly factor 3 n=1 Tax=Ornithodoros turicata TaxID=34597 RepID=A0A2R5LDU3_9ACAR
MSFRSYSYEGDGKTTVSVLNKIRDDILLLDSYSTSGFRLNNGLFVIGSVAVFPRSVLQWNIGGAIDICEESLSLFTLLEPKLDILVLGIGSAEEKLDSRLIRYLHSKRINVEVLPTIQACSTFNYLNAEARNVAAGLIPPNVVHTGDEIYVALDRVRRDLIAET